MGLAVPFEDNATISTTEYSLPNDGTTLTARTETGIFQVFLDLSALTVTEQYELKVYEKVQSGSTQRVVLYALLAGPLTSPGYALPSLFLKNGWDVTLKKIAGTDRNIGWSIRQVS